MARYLSVTGRDGMLAACAICLVYDCLFPHTVGGAERWYREPRRAPRRRRTRGHLPDAAPVGRGARRRGSTGACTCAPSGRSMALYTDGGRRRIRAAARVRRSACSGPPAARTAGATTSCTRPPSPTSRCSRRASRAGCGALRPRRRLARGLEPRLLAGIPRRGRRRDRMPRFSGCARGSPSAPSASRELHAERLREEGLRGEVTVLDGRVRRPARGARRPSRPSPSSCSPGG